MTTPDPVPALPPDWQVSTVQVTETTTYDVLVAHPPGATRAQIAAAGYEDYKASNHPNQTFPATLVEDEVTTDGDEIAPEEIDAARADWTPIGHREVAELLERRRRAA